MKFLGLKPKWQPPSGEYLPRKFTRVSTPNRLNLGGTEIWDLNGVGDLEAELPPVKHECYVHTQGVVNWFTVIHRCACGAVCYDHRPYDTEHTWIERNSRQGLK